MAMMGLLTSCEESYPPPGGWGGSYIDRSLVGSWQLINVNGYPVSGYQSNYFTFYMSGQGYYYYYQNGIAMSVPVTFWNENDYQGSWLCIQYPDSYSEMNYWFNSNGSYLYMSWMEGGRQQQYVYAFTSGFVWNAPAREKVKAADAAGDSMEAPGGVGREK